MYQVIDINRAVAGTSINVFLPGAATRNQWRYLLIISYSSYYHIKREDATSSQWNQMAKVCQGRRAQTQLIYFNQLITWTKHNNIKNLQNCTKSRKGSITSWWHNFDSSTKKKKCFCHQFSLNLLWSFISAFIIWRLIKSINNTTTSNLARYIWVTMDQKLWNWFCLHKNIQHLMKNHGK